MQANIAERGAYHTTRKEMNQVVQNANPANTDGPIVRRTISKTGGIQGNVRWRKSSISNPSGSCVQFAQKGMKRLIGDSKNPQGPVITTSISNLQSLLNTVKTGAFG